jgi:hypothetical protein
MGVRELLAIVAKRRARCSIVLYEVSRRGEAVGRVISCDSGMWGVCGVRGAAWPDD